MDAAVKRPYSSELRRRQARLTRQDIVTAATDLFLARGYGPTTVDDIAAAAGVGRKTVFRAVGGKPDCLKVAIDWAIAGDDEPVPIMQRPRVHASMQAMDARWILRDYADMYTTGAGRSAALFEVLRGAAGLDPGLAELRDDLELQRIHGMTHLAEHLDLREALHGDLTVPDAAQLLCTLADTAIYQRLVASHGWPPERFTHWLGQALVTELINPDYQPHPLPHSARAETLGVDTTALT
jgi:AcrR family transcriptional regulator